VSAIACSAVSRRFRRCITVFDLSSEVPRKRVIREGKAYKTNLLPGFDLPLARLFALADRWPADSGDDD